MKNSIFLFFKGLLIGIGKIIPGVSGSLIAIMLNVYEKSIYCISNLCKDFKKSFTFLFPLGIGIITSIYFGTGIIYILLKKYYSISMAFIIGTLVGIVPEMWKKNPPKKIVDFVFVFIPIFIILFIYKLKISCHNLLILGIVEAISMILPGISGTAIYLLLDSYDLILSLYINPVSFSFFLFIISVLLTFLLLCKILNYLIKNYHHLINITLSSFTTFSIFSLIMTYFKNISLFHFSYLFIFFFGFLISYLFNR